MWTSWLLCPSGQCQGQDTQLSELEVGDGEMSEVPVIHKEMISGLLCQLGTHKSVGPDGMHCQVFRRCLDLLLMI